VSLGAPIVLGSVRGAPRAGFWGGDHGVPHGGGGGGKGGSGVRWVHGHGTVTDERVQITCYASARLCTIATAWPQKAGADLVSRSRRRPRGVDYVVAEAGSDRGGVVFGGLPRGVGSPAKRDAGKCSTLR